MPDLSELPPPEEGASEGYYPDPLGGKYPRWWDGSNWTHRVGPEDPSREPASPLVEPTYDKSELVPSVPRRAGLIVLGAFRVYRRYPLLFLVLAAGVVVPFDLIALAVTGLGPYSRAGANTEALIVLGVLGYILIGPLISALHVHAVAEIREQRDPKLGPVARRGLTVLPVVVAVTIMAGLGIALGLVALIVPGVILFFRWYVVAQVAAIDHEGWLPALRGSHDLTHRNYGHIFAFGLWLILVLLIPNTVLPLAIGDQNSAGSFAVGVVANLFVASFTALATALLYFDLRARKEGASPLGARG